MANSSYPISLDSKSWHSSNGFEPRRSPSIAATMPSSPIGQLLLLEKFDFEDDFWIGSILLHIALAAEEDAGTAYSLAIASSSSS